MGQPNTSTRICFEVLAPSPTSPPSSRWISTISTKDSIKDTNPILYTRGGTKPMYKAITFAQEGRHKAKAQSKKVVTILGDYKDHKQYLSQYKIFENKFCNE